MHHRCKNLLYSCHFCTFNEQLLSMATQQGAWQEGCKVDKGLSQQGRHLLQGSFQLCCNADKANKNIR